LEVIPEKTLREELGPDPSTLRKYNISAVKITKSFKNARTIAARKAAEDIGSSLPKGSVVRPRLQHRKRTFSEAMERNEQKLG
jgi:hypothetical protein